nr:methyltransferase domain-containing protein [Candidatus Krumholzibacteria bacterium]
MTGKTNRDKAFPADGPWVSGRKVLDVRPAGEFRSGHLRGAYSFPLGKDGTTHGLPSIQLPPRDQDLWLVGNSDQPLEIWQRELEERGRAAVQVLVWVPESLAAIPGAEVVMGAEQGRLWEPPPWLVAHEDLLPPAAAGPVLDLGCGSGRAAVWLAERGYRVTGIDWQPEALDLGRELAASRGVHCTFLAGDLRDPEVVPAGPWAVVLNFRYLERPLLARVASWLIPGGVCLVRTFREAPGYEGHPQRRHRLERAELLGSFPTGQFSILAHEEGFDPDGRPAAGVTARRI